MGITPRRVLWLIGELSEGSAYAASEKGGRRHRPWTFDRVLLAGIFNALTAANYQRGNGKGRKPRPIEPPGIARQAEKRAAGGGRARAAAHIRRGIAAAKRAVVPSQEP